MKQELLSQCCTQQAGLSTCMMWPNYTLSTLTTTSMVMCYMTAKGANKLALVSIYETGGVVQPLSYEHNQGILCQGLQEEAAHRGRGLVQCDVHQPPGTGLHSPIYKHRFLHHHLQISPTQARVIALLKLRLIHYISEDWGKVVRTEEVDNNVLHRIHGFSKFTITDAVMFSVSKATDEISCFSVFWYCDYQERMPYSYQLIILSSEDDIGNFVVIYKQEIVTAQLWL